MEQHNTNNNYEKKKKIQKKKDYWREKRKEKKGIYKKTGRIELRSTADEKLFLVEKANELGIDLTDYMLESGLFNYVYKIDLSPLCNLSNEISKLGININQIARAANILKNESKITNDDFLKLIQELSYFQNSYKELSQLSKAYWMKLESMVREKSSIDFIKDEIQTKKQKGDTNEEVRS